MTSEFKQWRLSLGLSLTEAAKATGLKIRQVNYLNSGRCGIKASLRMLMDRIALERAGRGSTEVLASGVPSPTLNPPTPTPALAGSIANGGIDSVESPEPVEPVEPWGDDPHKNAAWIEPTPSTKAAPALPAATGQENTSELDPVQKRRQADFWNK